MFIVIYVNSTLFLFTQILSSTNLKTFLLGFQVVVVVNKRAYKSDITRS
jgi:hypothetical protein